MNILPRVRVSAAEWAHHSWGETKGPGITVPADALQALLDEYVRAMAALTEDVRSVLRERAESVPTVDTVGQPAP